MAELVAAIPGLRAVDGLAPVNFSVESADDALQVRVPDAVDAARVDAIVAAHDGTTPAWPPSDSDIVTWPAGDPDAAIVFDAASVDRVTAARVRRLVGGPDEELKRRERVQHHTYALDHETWADGRAVTAVERAEATDYLRDNHLLTERLERLRAEGRSFKHHMGFI